MLVPEESWGVYAGHTVTCHTELPWGYNSMWSRPPVIPTKLLIGQILVVFAIVILGVWAATTMRGLRNSRRPSQLSAVGPRRHIHRMRLMAPTIKSLRMSSWPIRLMPPSRVLPPDENCLGTRPSQAAKFLPSAKVRRSGAKAATAPAVTGPMPGMVQRRCRNASVRDARCRRYTSSSILSVKAR